MRAKSVSRGKQAPIRSASSTCLKEILDMDTFLGGLYCVAFNFAPVGFALCDGSLLPISQNTALFSLLGDHVWRRWDHYFCAAGSARSRAYRHGPTTGHANKSQRGCLLMGRARLLFASAGRVYEGGGLRAPFSGTAVTLVCSPQKAAPFFPQGVVCHYRPAKHSMRSETPFPIR